MAREAGVSRRTLFHCFGTKEDLHGGNQDRSRRAITDTMNSTPRSVSGGPARWACCCTGPARQPRAGPGAIPPPCTTPPHRVPDASKSGCRSKRTCCRSSRHARTLLLPARIPGSVR
ncbi:TetR/AcrR family transcriptional regulator [Streptomyces sp. P9-A2]|uniref:TetR/AcrR family transcriptional regulator n=1 Tax=Streptomyces sp. P9-A2 TaxID=3072284 RepID=UPI003FCC83FE